MAPGRVGQVDTEALEGAIDERGDVAGGEGRPPDVVGVEARPGFPGARRALEGLGGHLGAPHLRQGYEASVSAPLPPGACRRFSENRSGSWCGRARRGRRTTSPARWP